METKLKKLNIRFGILWFLDLTFRVFLPLLIISFRFGIFKDKAGFNTWFIIGFIISVSIVKNDVVDYFKTIENKGWYKAYKNVLWLTILTLIVFLTKFIVNHILYVLIAFLIGAITSIYFEPKKQRNRTLYNKLKEKEKD